ncbi:MAG: hypothetical protein KF708_24355 [Pirellulales bacterium]|nr:hypothetical protein [Pirellulales bacterium]
MSRVHPFDFMFQHGFEDLDGHQWELIWMDTATVGNLGDGRPAIYNRTRRQRSPLPRNG